MFLRDKMIVWGKEIYEKHQNSKYNAGDSNPNTHYAIGSSDLG
jgi:hypothetical protein